MPTPALPDEVLLEAVELRKKFKTLKEAAGAAGLPLSTFHDRVRQAADRGLDGSVPKPLPLGQRVKGTSTLYRMGDGEPEEVLQWVKTTADQNTEQLVEAIRSAFEEYRGKAPLISAPKYTDQDLLSVYPIADQHNGLLAWGRESGEDYDLKIGADRLRECMSRLVAQAPMSKHGLILNLGDWQHNDDGRNVTPKSQHILDVDSRYFKILTTGVQLMMDCIDLALQRHETVTVRNIPGNHDPHASIALTVALSAFYAKNHRVIVDDDPGEWFFHRFGEVLIGANHGHRAKAADMAMTMAVRRREDWGATKYHYFYFGHIHHETVKEVGDVRVESFQTLAAKDAYSAGHGFNSGQSLTSITLHRRDGEIGRHKVNIPPPNTSANAPASVTPTLKLVA